MPCKSKILAKILRMLQHKKEIVLFIILIVNGTGIAYSEKLPTPEELVLLIKAASEKYKTFDASLTTKAYHTSQGSDDTIYEQKIDFRLSKDKNMIFTKTEHSYVSDKKLLPPTTTTYASTPKFSKEMIERSDRKKIEGFVSVGKSTMSNAFISINEAMWDLFGWPYDQINFNEASVACEKNIYILMARLGNKPNGPQLVLYIDPSKGYVPIEKKLLRPDGTVLFRLQLGNFHEICDGCYIPYTYTFSDTEADFIKEYDVQKIKLNESIPDDLLTFAFKNGTSVYDEIAGLRYAIGDPCSYDSDPDEMVELGVNKSNVLEPTAITSKTPDERDLQGPLMKTKELISFPKKLNKKSCDIHSFRNLSFVILSIITVGLIILCIRIYNKK